jgi:nitroreductase
LSLPQGFGIEIQLMDLYSVDIIRSCSGEILIMDTTLLSLLRKRRSIRRYKKRSIETNKIDKLIEAALRAPTSRGRNPWEFIVVTAPRLLVQLAAAKEHGSAFLSDAPLAIVVAADTTRSDVWIEDCAIAAMVIQLTAEDLGLGSCWVQIRQRSHDSVKSSEEYLNPLLGLPATHSVECILGIGYPDEEKAGHPAEGLPCERVHRDRFANKV